MTTKATMIMTMTYYSTLHPMLCVSGVIILENAMSKEVTPQYLSLNFKCVMHFTHTANASDAVSVTSPSLFREGLRQA